MRTVLLTLSVLLFLAAASTASAAVVGIQSISATTASNSSNKSATVSCPAGKKVLSAGADVNPGNGDVLIDDVRPSADLQSVTVNALEDETGTAANWTVSALAICAYPPTGLQRVSTTSPLNSSNKSVVATCPSGKRLLGVGADLNTFVGQVLLDDMRPDAGLTNVTVNALEDETGNSTNWSVTAYGICAAPVPGLTRVTGTSSLDSSGSRVVNAPCPAGQKLTGVGGDANSFVGQVVLDAAFAAPGGATAGYAAFEDDTGNSTPWSLTVYGICANAVERLVAQSGVVSGTGAFVEPHVPCGAGMRPTGVGADLTGARGRAFIGTMWVYEDLASGQFMARSFPDLGPIGRWSMRAYAICATPPAGYERPFVTGPFGVDLTVTCPGSKSLIGLGGGLTVPDRTSFDGIFPNSGLRSMTIEGSDEYFGTPVCANTPPGLQLVSSTSPPDSEEIADATVSCPAGKHLYGVGGRVTGESHVMLDDIRPNDALTNVVVTGVEADEGYDPNWTVTAYGICVTA